MKRILILSLLATLIFVACQEEAPVISKIVVDEDTIFATEYDTVTVPETLWLTEHDTIYDTIYALSDTIPHKTDAFAMAQVYVSRAIRDYAVEHGLEEPKTWFMPYGCCSDPIDRTTHWEVVGHHMTDVFGPYNEWSFYCEIRYIGGEVDRSYNWIVDTLRWDVTP